MMVRDKNRDNNHINEKIFIRYNITTKKTKLTKFVSPLKNVLMCWMGLVEDGMIYGNEF